jgi:hypothetical protein
MHKNRLLILPVNNDPSKLVLLPNFYTFISVIGNCADFNNCGSYNGYY